MRDLLSDDQCHLLLSLGLLSGKAVCGCGTGSKPQKSFDARSLGEQAEALNYRVSFDYSDPPTEGHRLNAAGVSSAVEPCAVLHENTSPDSFFAINIETGRSSLGAHTLSANHDENYVERVRVDSDEVVTAPITVSGTMRCVAEPTAEATWEDPRTPESDVTAGFEIDLIASGECNGGQKVNGDSTVGSVTGNGSGIAEPFSSVIIFRKVLVAMTKLVKSKLPNSRYLQQPVQRSATFKGHKWPHIVAHWASLLVSILLGACQNHDGSMDGSECRSSCESRYWARVYVGIVPPIGSVSMDVVTSSIGRAPATVGGCPGEFDFHRYICSFSYSTAPTDQQITLIATVDGKVLPEHTMALRNFNYCGRDIAYAELQMDGTEPRWSEVTYMSPCSAF